MKRSVLVLVLAGAAAVSGCAGQRRAVGHAPAPPGDGVVRTAGCATATSPPAMSIDGTPQPANQEALDEVASRVQPRADKDFADVYAGLQLVQERDRIQVFRKPSAAFDRWIVHDFAADCVEVLDAKYSAVELTAMQQRIEHDMAYWQQHGIRITSIGADPTRGVVVVGTVDDQPARAQFPAHYPGLPVEVRHQDPVTW